MNKDKIKSILEHLHILEYEYCILGSGSLVLRGLKKNANDLDIAITKKGLNELLNRYQLVYQNNHYILEIPDLKVEFIVKNKEEIKIEYYLGYPLQNIEQLLANKKKRNLEKDRLDIEIIEKYKKNSYEYLDLYDKSCNITGEIINRKNSYILPKKRYIITTIVFIINSRKELLIQKTSANRGSIYATTGGHVKSGMNSLQTIKEEIKEELGLNVLSDDFVYLGREKMSYKFQDIYLLQKDYDLSEITLQKKEVSNVEWLSLHDIDKLIANDLFRKSNIYGYNLLKTYLNKSSMMLF